MPSGENINRNSGEDSGNRGERQTYQERGRMTVEAKMQAKEQAKLAELARRRELVQMHEDIIKEQDTAEIIKKAAAAIQADPEYRAILESLGKEAASNPETAPVQAPETSEAPTSEVVSAPVPVNPNQTTDVPAPAPEMAVPATEVAPAPAPAPEVAPASSETIERLNEKAKKQGGLKKLLVGLGILGLTGAITVGALTGGSKKRAEEIPNNPTNIETETDYDAGEDDGAQYEAEEAEKGIKDGYGEKGMWLSENKPSKNAFASAAEVAEVCNKDEHEMIKYAADNQVESFADYLANLPEQLQPEAFRGLNETDTEKKLESLSADEYDALQSQFGQTVDAAHVRHTTLNGRQKNALMRPIDANGAIVHGNMELVACVTNENNLEVADLYWTDDGTAEGREIGHETFKITYDDEGNIGGCLQVVVSADQEVHAFAGVPIIEEESGDSEIHRDESESESESESEHHNDTEIVDNHNNSNETTNNQSKKEEKKEEKKETTPETVQTEAPQPVTPQPETPQTEAPQPETPAPQPETNAPKNEAAEIQNAGEHVDQQSLNETVTPATTLEQDQANFAAVEEQRRQEEAAAAEAARQAEQQAEAERQAAAEAEQRRQEEEAAAAAQAQADAEAAARAEAEQQAAAEAEQRAAEQAAAEQAARAEAEQQAAAEQAAREEAQRQADAQAAEQAAAAEANADNTFEERADDFANGNF